MRKNLGKKEIKKENGAISTLVLFTVLLFVVILMGTYLVVTSLEKSQLKSDIRIQEVYGQDVNQVEEIYNEILAKYPKYDEPYIPEGFSHIGEENWNSGYRISDTGDETGNIFVWIPCVISQSAVKSNDKVVTFEKTLPETTETTDSYYMYNTKNLTITDNLDVVEDIKTSVQKYGGFYIAAYEAGIEDTQGNYDSETGTGKTATDGSVKPLSKPNKGVWDYISRENALIVSESMVNTVDGVKSTLVTGECWDTTLQWMVKTSENATKEPNLEYDINSLKKGRYNDVASDVEYLTGYFSVNNIYDMGGNAWEWTTENCKISSSEYFVHRGGSYGNNGSINPAAFRTYRKVAEADGLGFRVVLYK